MPGIDAVVRDAERQALLRPCWTTRTFGYDGSAHDDRKRPQRSDCPKTPTRLTVAAAINPVMSSWVALRHRITFKRGASVLVLGATGSAGRMAIQVAKRFGAKEVIGAGRNATATQGAHGARRRPAAHPRPTRPAPAMSTSSSTTCGANPPAKGMVDLITHRRDRGKELTWIQIGAMAGPSAEILSAVLRRAARRSSAAVSARSTVGDFRKEIAEDRRGRHRGSVRRPHSSDPAERRHHRTDRHRSTRRQNASSF